MDPTANLPVVQGHTPCPPAVMVLAQEMNEAIDGAIEADIADRAAMAAADRRLHAADAALHAAGWRLSGPTDNVPGGALSWVVERGA